MKMDNIYVVGDIHGEIFKLNNLFKILLTLIYQDPTVLIVFLGDYINKGKDSEGVLSLLIWFKKYYPDNCIFLAGNHEKILLEAANGTFSSELNEAVFDTYYEEFKIENKLSISEEHLGFIRELKDEYILDDILFLHAGIDIKGNKNYWSYGIEGPLPEGISLVFRGHQIVKAPEIRENNIAIDTGAFLDDGYLSCCKYDLKNKKILGYL